MLQLYSCLMVLHRWLLGGPASGGPAALTLDRGLDVLMPLPHDAIYVTGRAAVATTWICCVGGLLGGQLQRMHCIWPTGAMPGMLCMLAEPATGAACTTIMGLCIASMLLLVLGQAHIAFIDSGVEAAGLLPTFMRFRGGSLSRMHTRHLLFETADAAHGGCISSIRTRG